MEVEAPLSYQFVFLGPEDEINPFGFPLAIILAKGKRLALAPIYLSSLYARLDKCVNNVARSVGRYEVVPHRDVELLQIFL